jgi:hypothetical protein
MIKVKRMERQTIVSKNTKVSKWYEQNYKKQYNMKTVKYHTDRIVPNSNGKIGIIETKSTHTNYT